MHKRNDDGNNTYTMRYIDNKSTNTSQNFQIDSYQKPKSITEVQNLEDSIHRNVKFPSPNPEKIQQNTLQQEIEIKEIVSNIVDPKKIEDSGEFKHKISNYSFIIK